MDQFIEDLKQNNKSKYIPTIMLFNYLKGLIMMIIQRSFAYQIELYRVKVMLNKIVEQHFCIWSQLLKKLVSAIPPSNLYSMYSNLIYLKQTFSDLNAYFSLEISYKFGKKMDNNLFRGIGYCVI